MLYVDGLSLSKELGGTNRRPNGNRLIAECNFGSVMRRPWSHRVYAEAKNSDVTLLLESVGHVTNGHAFFIWAGFA